MSKAGRAEAGGVMLTRFVLCSPNQIQDCRLVDASAE